MQHDPNPRDGTTGSERAVTSSHATEDAPFRRDSSTAASVESITRIALIASVAFYWLGLVITNVSAQRYGQSTLDLIEARYVLVGLLWMALTLLGSTLASSFMQVVKLFRPRKNNSFLKNLEHLSYLGASCFGMYVISVSALGMIGLENAFTSRWLLPILGILVATDKIIRNLFFNLLKEFDNQRRGHESILSRLAGVDRLPLARQIVFLLSVVVAYTIVVYPNLSPALGGGKLPHAEVMIRADKRSLFRALPDFKLDDDGVLGPILVVEEGNQRIVLTNSTSILNGGPSLVLDKAFVEFVLYKAP